MNNFSTLLIIVLQLQNLLFSRTVDKCITIVLNFEFVSKFNFNEWIKTKNEMNGYKGNLK